MAGTVCRGDFRRLPDIVRIPEWSPVILVSDNSVLSCLAAARRMLIVRRNEFRAPGRGHWGMVLWPPFLAL